MDKRSAVAVERFRNGPPVYCGTKSGRSGSDVAQTAGTKNRLHRGCSGRSCGERSRGGQICSALRGFTGETGARNKKLDGPAWKKRGAFPGCKSVGQNLCAVFANESGRSGGCHCPSRHQAPAASPPRARARRIYQCRHGELCAEKYDSRAVQNHFDRGGVQRLAACRDCYPGLFARFRGRLARPDRVGPCMRHSLRSPTRERRILGLRDNEIGPERIESSGLSSKARKRLEFRKAYARAF